MIRRARGLCALVLACAAGACSSGPGAEPTQVLVVIDAQSEVRAAAARMQIVVQSAPDRETVHDRTLLRAQGEIVLPYVLALVPRDGDATRRFEVIATVHDENDEFVAQVRAIGGYVRNRRVVLWLMLEDSCKHVTCPREDETCRQGSCESAVVEPEDLDPLDEVDLPDSMPVTPGEPNQDAGGAGSGTSGDGSGTGGTTAGRGGNGGRGGTGSGGSGGIPGAGQGAGGQPAACDEGDQQPCGTSEGECSPGTQSCSGGEWGACSGQVEGGAEQCDGQDDDCDGDTDENAPCAADDLPNAAVAACFLGACRAILCDSQWDDCNSSRSDGCEQSLTTLAHCGGCGDACDIAHAAESCATGSCQITSCDSGWDDCDEDGDSCETQLGTIDDCSACGDACAFTNATAECADNAGVRSCRFTGCASSRYASCDGMDSTGCEIDLHTNPNRCGACNYDCETRNNVASATCTAGACSFDCEQDFLDCDGDPDNGCEHDYSVSGVCSRCFDSGTSNFAGNNYTYTAAANFNCGGTHTFNSTTQTWDTGCCGTCPSATAPVAQTGGGPSVVILRATSLQVASGTTLRLVGQHPVIFAVRGDAAIAGVIDASASGSVPGAGGDLSCGTSTGPSGTGSASLGAGGGGGGGFGTPGGGGGSGGYGDPGAGGATRGAAALSPLLGGCGGGKGGGCSNALIGAGGGAFQVSAAGALTVTGTLRANGGAGVSGCGDEGGGSGGGSGGGILLEASILQTTAATLLANGGPGGAGAGGPVGGSGSTSGMLAGSQGLSSTFNGGSGGGGGYGRVSVRDCLAP